MAKKKEKDYFSIERYRIISEFNKVHMKKSWKVMIRLLVMFFLIAVLTHAFFIMYVWNAYALVSPDIKGGDNSWGTFTIGAALLVVIVVLLVVYYRELRSIMLGLYYEYKEDYKVLYLSGLRQGNMVWELASYPIVPLVFTGIVGVALPAMFIKAEELSLSLLSIFFVLMLVVISYRVMYVLYMKHFMKVIGISDDDECDISKVDGKYKLIPWLSVEENAALPYRMLRGKDSVTSNTEISWIARDLNVDGLLRVEAVKLMPVHKVQAMILRAYCVAGKDIVLDECILGGLSEKDLEVVNKMMARIKSPHIAVEYTPSNEVKNGEKYGY